MQTDKHRLDAILNDSGSTPAEKAVAQAQLDSVDSEDGDYSEETIFPLLWADGVIDMSEQYLRAVYLADPQISIHWAWLKFWADRLRSESSTLRKLAECRIKMLADDVRIPEDLRRASAEFLAQLKQTKHGDALPPINIPGNERWRTMPPEELRERMAVQKKSWTDAFHTAR